MTETNRIEFKRELTRELDIEKEVIAFLNYREGGVIYIGVDDSGIPVGVRDIDGDMLRIKDRIKTGIAPSPMGLFDVLVEVIDGVQVIKIFVASGSEKPYYKARYGMSEKGCYLRIGTSAEPMPTNMIEDLYSHRVRNSLRSIRSPRQNLSFRQLHIYYESKGMSLNDKFIENLDLQTDNGEFNYVAYLLADENSMSIKVAKYAGSDRDELIANNEFGFCSLLKATDQVLDKLRVENEISSQITYKRRIDTPLWDERAMREIVINAIVHNDYYTNEVPPKFELFSDHIEITSAGRLPVGLTKDEFFSGISAPRNKELMRVFRDVDMVEALGSGMMRIRKAYPKKIFTFTDNFIKTTIPFHSQKTEKRTSREENNLSVERLDFVKDFVKDFVNELSQRQIGILGLIAESPTMSAMEISQKMNVTSRTIQSDLAHLQSKGLLHREGGRRTGRWVLDAK